MVTCPRCGKENPEANTFCKRCGASLRDPDAEAEPAPRQAEPTWGDSSSHQSWEWEDVDPHRHDSSPQREDDFSPVPTQRPDHQGDPLPVTWTGSAADGDRGTHPGRNRQNLSPRSLVKIVVALAVVSFVIPLVVSLVFQAIDGTDDGGSATEDTATSTQDPSDQAQSYLKYKAWSRDGLVAQLVHDGYDEDEAAQAVDSLGMDWNQQATDMAQEYLDYTSMSRERLESQLRHEQFTPDQVAYAIDHCDANWNGEAAEEAQSLVKGETYSHDQLVERLVGMGFTQEQAEYGASKAL